MSKGHTSHFLVKANAHSNKWLIEQNHDHDINDGVQSLQHSYVKLVMGDSMSSMADWMSFEWQRVEQHMGFIQVLSQVAKLDLDM